MIMDMGFYKTMSKVSWGFRYTLLSNLPPFFKFLGQVVRIDSLEVFSRSSTQTFMRFLGPVTDLFLIALFFLSSYFFYSVIVFITLLVYFIFSTFFLLIV